MYLPDVNVWLALAFEGHVHHVPAVAWFGRSAVDGCAFCRLTQQGFLRLATNPSAFGDEAVTCARAWELYDQFTADARILFADEPANLETAWREYSSRRSYSPKSWSDSYVAAFSRSAGLRLVSFDQGLLQYANVDLVLLQA